MGPMERSALLLVLVGCAFEGRNTVEPDARPPDDSPEVTPRVIDVPCVADVYLRTDLAPDENTNDRDYVIVDGDFVAPAIFRFDLTAIPSAATAIAAELHVWVDGEDGAPMLLHQLLESWDEATVTSNSRSAGIAWLGAGATPPSRSAEAIGTLSPAPVNVYAVATLDAGTVASWVTAPASNHGVLLRTEDEDGAWFASRERAAANQQPFMRITYLP